MKIDERIKKQADEIGSDYAAVLLEAASDYFRERDATPIEVLFGLELFYASNMARVANRDPFTVGFQYALEVEGKNYKIDFVLCRYGLPEPCVGIELDGHDFHEKTKEQVRKDKARERAIVASGIPILRFSGSEIWRDPASCVYETVKFYGKSVASQSNNADGVNGNG